MGDSMPEKLYYLNEFTESVYDRIEKTLENLTQEERNIGEFFHVLRVFRFYEWEHLSYVPGEC